MAREVIQHQAEKMDAHEQQSQALNSGLNLVHFLIYS